MISKKEAIIIFSFCQGNDYEVDFKKPRFSFYNLSNFFEISDITRLLNNYLNYYNINGIIIKFLLYTTNI